MLGAIIGGATSLLGGFLNRRSSERQAATANQVMQGMSAEDRAFQERWNNIALEENRRAIQTRVADARAAGLHPLFALGGGLGGSPSFDTSPVASGFMQPSGSGLGTGIAEAGAAIGDAVSARRERKARAEVEKAHLRQLNASALRDEMAAALTASEIKRAEQTVLTKRPAGDGVELRPYDFGATTAFGRRPTLEHPRQSHPGQVEMVDRSGRRRYVLNPDLGMDEVGQVEYVKQRIMEGIEEFFLRWATAPGSWWGTNRSLPRGSKAYPRR